MEVLTKIPLTLTERIAYGEVFREEATWEEFVNALKVCEYRIEYNEGEIFSFMGYASENHELIVAQMIHLLKSLLINKDFKISGSNLALYIPGLGKRYFNADCTLVKGQSQKVEFSKGMYAVANPVLLVEVLSPSTENHDIGRKFKQYRKIDALQQVLFISSTSLEVTSQKRMKGTNEWLLQEFTTIDDLFPILEQGEIELKELYDKIEF